MTPPSSRTLREEVARKLHDAGVRFGPWENLSEEMREQYLVEADAAIEAMHKFLSENYPSIHMIKSGAREKDSVVDTFQSMHRAALEEITHG